MIFPFFFFGTWCSCSPTKSSFSSIGKASSTSMEFKSPDDSRSKLASSTPSSIISYSKFPSSSSRPATISGFTSSSLFPTSITCIPYDK
ncbi:hypothetical protein YC2023_119957 [Brassica napus]